MTPPAPERLLLEPCVRAALAEDLGRLGDITSQALIAPGALALARLSARRDGVLAGLDAAMLAFRLMDEDLRLQAACEDGERLRAGAQVLLVEGNARAILAAERTALNFLAHLSGIATATAAAVEAARGCRARICCTRKTAPGLRVLEKRAVALGGGDTHRFGLDDAILIKDNHLALCGGAGEGIRAALEAARAAAPGAAVIVEVDGLDQLESALQAGAGRILLDNMDTEELARAVEAAAGRALLEASGGITLERVREVAQTGVDFISLGALTHSAAALDFSLEAAPVPAQR